MTRMQFVRLVLVKGDRCASGPGAAHIMPSVRAHRRGCTHERLGRGELFHLKDWGCAHEPGLIRDGGSGALRSSTVTAAPTRSAEGEIQAKWPGPAKQGERARAPARKWRGSYRWHGWWRRSRRRTPLRSAWRGGRSSMGGEGGRHGAPLGEPLWESTGVSKDFFGPFGRACRGRAHLGT